MSILMGIVREPEIRDYWCLLHYSPIAGRIRRRRFEEITRYFYLVNNTILLQIRQPGYNCLQDVLDLVHKQFLAVYSPHATISVDEAMIPFKSEICIQHTYLQNIHCEHVSLLHLLLCSLPFYYFCIWVHSHFILAPKFY